MELDFSEEIILTDDDIRRHIQCYHYRDITRENLAATKKVTLSLLSKVIQDGRNELEFFNNIKTSMENLLENKEIIDYEKIKQMLKTQNFEDEFIEEYIITIKKSEKMLKLEKLQNTTFAAYEIVMRWMAEYYFNNNRIIKIPKKTKKQKGHLVQIIEKLEN